ncbi:MAG: Qat anti-phage system QueC-like protein QatC [Patescibacteria group bacterium]
MNKVICAPDSILPATLVNDVNYFSMYSYSHRDGVGHIAPTLRSDVKKKGFSPTVRVWDFLSIALAVAAADLSCKRSNSSDGWTRVIEVDVYLCEHGLWVQQKSRLESILRVLTGDFWKLNFLPGAEPPPQASVLASYDADCISLLSGGMDSLVGAIDLTATGRKPLFVSQVVKGDRKSQMRFANTLGASSRYFNWSHPVSLFNRCESSTRGRSIIFFAYGLLAASALNSRSEAPIEVVVPENGFMSLNPSLNSGRSGSLSTKTTHPLYAGGLQEIWDMLSIPVKLSFPFRFKTKGEILSGCCDQAKLTGLIGESTSCGKFGRYKLVHCGRCLPCLVRRAAFLKAQLTDTTVNNYHFQDLSKAGREFGPNDIGAVAMAYLNYKKYGIQRFAGGALSFASSTDRPQYEGVLSRGLDELGQLLIKHGVI